MKFPPPRIKSNPMPSLGYFDDLSAPTGKTQEEINTILDKWQKPMKPPPPTGPKPRRIPSKLTPPPAIPLPITRPVIHVDPRAGSGEFLEPLSVSRLVQAQSTRMEFGDFAFTGQGPNGPISIGLERKTLGDLIQSCTGENRLFNRQIPGMMREYDIPIILIEGLFTRCHSDPNSSMVCSDPMRGGWRMDKHLSYGHLTGILSSLLALRIQTLHSPGPDFTVELLTRHALWFARPWKSHSLAKISLPKIEIRQHGINPMLALAQMRATPFTAKVLSQIDGVGPDKALALAKEFPTLWSLMATNCKALESVKGIGPKLATKIYEQLHQ